MKLKIIFKSFAICTFSLVLATSNISSYDLYADNKIFDYSRENSLDTVVVKGESLYGLITKTDDLNELEKKHLNSTNYELRYENKIPTNKTYTILNGTDLFVHASKYEYLARNDQTVSWIPYSATLDTETVYFNYVEEEEEYICEFNNVNEDDESINIQYTTSLILENGLVNEFINYTYDLAKGYVDDDIVGKTENINSENERIYQEHLNKYNQYIIDSEQYKIDYQNYLNYQIEKQVYDEKLAKYNQYLSNLDTYNKNLEKYQKYLNDYKKYQDYQTYLTQKAQYDKAYKEYEALYAKNKETFDKINYYLDVMELIVTPRTTLKRTLYHDIMGDSVTQVLSRRGELSQLGVPESLIDEAEDATYALRDIITKYFALTSNEAKFNFYKANYRNIKSNFEALLKSLDALYKYEAVDFAVNFMDKKPQFVILLSNLTMMCNAISKDPVKGKSGSVLDKNSIIGGKKVIENLEYDFDFVERDDIAYPSASLVYVELPVEPTPITPVEKVDEPTPVVNPGNPPTEVNNPGVAPVVVAKPVEPTIVTKPIKPEIILIDQDILELIDVFNSNLLIERIEYDTPLILSLSSNINKKFRNTSDVVVEFYDLDNNFIERYQTEKNSYILYESYIPVKPADEVFSEYTFSHWEYEDGERLDLNCVTKDGFVHPVFYGSKYQTYNITWLIDDHKYTDEFEYGETPVCDYPIIKKSDNNYYYEFDGWDKEIQQVTSKEKYTAVFKGYPFVSDGTNDAIITRYKTQISIDATNLSLQNVDFTTFFEKVIDYDNQYNIVISSKDYVVKLSQAVVSQIKMANVKNIYLDIQKLDNKNEYSYIFSLLDVSGNSIQTSLPIVVTVNGEFNKNQSKLYLNVDQTLTEVEIISFSSKQLSFEAESGEKYIVFPTYQISLPEENDDYKFSIEKSENIREGETISFNLEVNESVKSYNLIIMDGLGKIIDTSNNSFVMPSSNVTIRLNSIVYKSFTITFVSDGNIISSKQYKYGETVTIPPTPIKSADENYSYEFIGWNEIVSKAYETKTYVAEFKAIPIEKLVQPSKFNIVAFAKTMVIIMLSLTAAMVTILILFKKNVLSKEKIRIFFKKIKNKIALKKNKSKIVLSKKR